MKVRIDVDTNTFVRFWLVVIGFVLAGLIIYSARTALIIIGIAFFLALALNRPVSALASRLPGKSRVGGTAIAFILVVGFLGAFLSLVVPPIVQQTAKVVATVPDVVDRVQGQWEGLHKLVQHYGLETQVDQALESVKSSAASWAGDIGNHFVSSVGSLVNFLTGAFLVLVISFLMLVEAPRWLEVLWSVYDNKKRLREHKTLLVKMYNVVTGYVTGQLTVSGIGALFTAITVFVLSFIFNVPHNLALPSAAIAFVLSLIPMFGATIGGVLICLLLAFNDLTAALIFAIYFVVYQQIENNFISPVVQSKTVELSALAILVSVTIGIYLFGILGGIISIPIAGIIKVLLEDYFARTKDKEAPSSDSKPLANFVKKAKELI